MPIECITEKIGYKNQKDEIYQAFYELFSVHTGIVPQNYLFDKKKPRVRGLLLRTISDILP